MSARLFVLGVLYEREAHGYEIQEVARLWAIERWTPIRSGSLYHALSQMEKQGLIVARRTEKSGNRPTRTVFAATDEGRAEFLSLLRSTMATCPVEDQSIDLALAFCANLPAEERVQLLNERQLRLESQAALLRTRLESVVPHRERLGWVEAALRHLLDRTAAEIGSNQMLIASVPAFKKRDWTQLPVDL